MSHPIGLGCVLILTYHLWAESPPHLHKLLPKLLANLKRPDYPGSSHSHSSKSYLHQLMFWKHSPLTETLPDLCPIFWFRVQGRCGVISGLCNLVTWPRNQSPTHFQICDLRKIIHFSQFKLRTVYAVLFKRLLELLR